MARDNGEAHPMLRDADEDPEFDRGWPRSSGSVGACGAVHGDEICGGVELRVCMVVEKYRRFELVRWDM